MKASSIHELPRKAASAQFVTCSCCERGGYVLMFLSAESAEIVERLEYVYTQDAALTQVGSLLFLGIITAEQSGVLNAQICASPLPDYNHLAADELAFYFGGTAPAEYQS